MNDKTIDLTHSLHCGNSSNSSSNENPPQDILIQTLRKFDVDFEQIKKEVNILYFRILQSNEKDRNSVFTEFESVSYKLLFTTYNVEFFVRILSFHNDIQCQILKIDIEPKTTNIKKEIEYCLNSLQRRRNLDLMFKTLIVFGKFIESRRLICDLVLKKNHKVSIEQNKDGGIIIVYSDEIRNLQLGIFWSIACSSTHDVTDVIEVYYKVVELSNKMGIKYTLNKLTEPCLDFTKKYHLWKSLIDELSEKSLIIKIDKMPNATTTNEPPQPITILPDSEDTSGRTLVINLDKFPDQSIVRSSRSRVLEVDKKLDKSTSHYNTQEVQDLGTTFRKSLVVRVDKMPASSSTDSQNEKRACTEHTTENTINRDSDVLTYLQLGKTSIKDKVEGKNDPFVIRKALRASIRQISKNKRAELISADSSDSDIIKKKTNQTGTISLDSDSDVIKYGASDSDLSELSEDSDVSEHSEWSEDSDISEGSVNNDECSSDCSGQTKAVPEHRQKKKKITLNTSRRSPRLSTVSSTQESSASPYRKSSSLRFGYNTRGRKRVDSDCSNNRTPTSRRDVATSMATPNKGLILLSDSSHLGSLLSVTTPQRAQAASTPQKNLRIRLVPDGPVVRESPSFVELNLMSPSKKTKIIDDDLEITSVTYIVPD